MKYRVLAALPVAMSFALVTASLALGDRMRTAFVVGNEGGKLLAAAGTLTAAFAFERGEYLRRAWLALAACYAVLLGNDAIGAVCAGWTHEIATRAVVVTLANGCAVASTAMLARTWNVAGLSDDPGERMRRRTIFVIAAVMSFGLCAWPIAQDTLALLRGDLRAIAWIPSDVGDALTLALIVPVAQTALAMRGGLLHWPWALLTASAAAWLLYDVASSTLDFHHMAPGWALAVSEALRTLGNGWAFAAGIAQRMAVVTPAVSRRPGD